MPPGKAQAAEDAIKWMLAFENEEMRDVEHRGEFSDWLKSSPMHVDEFLRASALHETLCSLPEFHDIKQLIDDMQDVVVPMPERTEPGTTATDREVDTLVADTNAGHRQIGWGRLAAMAVGLLAMAASIHLALPKPKGAVYATMSGEVRSVTLEDGSRINLDAESKVRVRMSDASRFAELTHGGILFNVEEDSKRRFTVDAGELVVHVLGTQFNMRRDIVNDSTRTELTVINGSVRAASPLNINLQATSPSIAGGPGNAAVSETGEPGTTARILDLFGGDQIIIITNADSRKAAVVIKTGERLTFKNTPLGEVVEVFNQHAGPRLVVTAPSLASMEITTTFNTRDGGTLINAITRQPGVRSERRGDTVYLRKGDLPRKTAIPHSP